MSDRKFRIRPNGLLLALLAVLLLANTACFTVDVLMKVKPDGTGTLENEFTVKNAFIQQLQAMASTFTEAGSGTEAEAPDLFSEESLKRMGESMGPGVELVKTEKLQGADYEGARAVYSFSDITTVRTSTTPSPPGSSGEGAGRSDDEKLRFTLERKGGKSILTLIPPEPDVSDATEKDEVEVEKTPEERAQQEAALGMMKQFLQGFRMRMRIIPEGKVLDTNARYIDGQGAITLMEMDFDQLLAADGVLEKMMSGDRPESAAEMQKMLEGVPGIKMQIDEPIVIEFR